jgi:hypothetical protein
VLFLAKIRLFLLYFFAKKYVIMLATDTPAVQSYLAELNNAWKMRLFMFSKLPTAYFMGLKVKNVTTQRAQIALPYGWRSQNPFQSIYFAAQCAAAEMSTGLLAMTAIRATGKNVSMLVSKIESEFLKKANSTTIFTCEDGDKVFALLEKAMQTGEPQQITMTSLGVQATGETVSKTSVTWSFRVKN